MWKGQENYVDVSYCPSTHMHQWEGLYLAFPRGRNSPEVCRKDWAEQLPLPKEVHRDVSEDVTLQLGGGIKRSYPSEDVRSYCRQSKPYMELWSVLETLQEWVCFREGERRKEVGRKLCIGSKQKLGLLSVCGTSLWRFLYILIMEYNKRGRDE